MHLILWPVIIVYFSSHRCPSSSLLLAGAIGIAPKWHPAVETALSTAFPTSLRLRLVFWLSACHWDCIDTTRNAMPGKVRAIMAHFNLWLPIIWTVWNIKRALVSWHCLFDYWRNCWQLGEKPRRAMLWTIFSLGRCVGLERNPKWVQLKRTCLLSDPVKCYFYIESFNATSVCLIYFPCIRSV